MPLIQIVYDEGVAQSDVSRDGGDIDERGFCGEGGGRQSGVRDEGGGGRARYCEIESTLCQPCTEFSSRGWQDDESGVATSAAASTASSDTAGDADVPGFFDKDLGHWEDGGNQCSCGSELELQSSFAQRLLPRLKGDLSEVLKTSLDQLP